MPEKITATNMNEAEALLRQNLDTKALEELAQNVDEETMRLLVSVAISLSGELKNSALSTFAVKNKK